MSHIKNLLVSHVEAVENILGCHMGQAVNAFMVKKDPSLKLTPAELSARILSWELIHSFLESNYADSCKNSEYLKAQIAARFSTLLKS